MESNTRVPAATIIPYTVLVILYTRQLYRIKDTEAFYRTKTIVKCETVQLKQ